MTTVESNDSTVGFFFSSFVTSARTLPVSMAARSLTRDALWEVDDVEWVLAPLTVVLTAVSNITLLAHEGRVVWLTRRLIPPKLLVLSLCSADLLATVTGFLPLWLFFVLPHSASPAPLVTSPPEPAWSSSENSSGVSPSVSPSSSVSTDLTSSPDHSVGVAGVNPVVLTAGYSVSVFLLAMFWTLAQCIVVVMGIERFLALRAPFFYTARCSSQAFLAAIGLLALASGGVGAFHMLVHRHDVRTDPVVYAGFMDSGSLAYNAFTLTQGLVWTVVLLLCNWAVTHELRRMEQRVTVMRMKDQSEYLKQLSLVHGAGREFARFMMAVNVVFLLSSLPNLVCVLLRLCCRAPSFAVQYFCWRMSHISALLNPFLYGFLRKSLRSRIRRALNRHVPCLRSNQVEDLDPAPTTVRFNARLSSATMPRDPEASTVQLSA